MRSRNSDSRSVLWSTRRLFSASIIGGLTFALIVLLVTGTFGQTVTAGANDPTNLELGQPVDRELKGGEKHLFQIDLASNQYAKVILAQSGIEVVVRQVDAAGKILAKYDDDPGTNGEVIAGMTSSTGGRLFLTVEPLQNSAPKGGYEIHLDEIRPATPKDLARDEGVKLITEVNRLWRDNQYDQAIPLAERAIEIEKRELGNDAPEVSTALFALANQYNDKGEYDKAEPLFLEALHIREKVYGKDSLSLTGILTNLTSLYGDKGDYDKADAVARRALEIRERELEPDHPLIASVLNNLAIVNHLRGDDVKAATYYQRVLDIREKVLGPDDPQVAIALTNIAGIYTDRSKAEPLYLRALAIAEKALGPEHRYTAQILFNLAVLYDRAGDFVKAEPMCKRALSIYEKVYGQEHPNLAFPLDLLATINKNKGDYDNAESLYLRAIGIREKKQGPYHQYLGTTLANLANLYAIKGDIDKAVTTQARANAILEYNISLNIMGGSERQKISYLKTFSGIENQTIALNMQTAPSSASAADLAVTSILQRKGRVLDAVSDSFAAMRRRSNAKDQTLLDTLNKTTQGLASFVLGGPRELTPVQFEQKVEALEQKREDLETQIGRNSLGFYQPAKPVTLDAVRKVIPENAALVEFCVYRPVSRRGADTVPNTSPLRAMGNPHYVVYVVRTQGDVRGVDLGEVAGIDNSLDDFRRSLRDPKSTDVRDLARRIDEKVMRPVRALLGTAHHLLISPEGNLNLIPFEALVNEKGKYLVEDYSISYLTSGRDLLRVKVPRDSKSQPLLIADPLFGSPQTQVAVNIKADNIGLARSGRTGKVRGSVTSVKDLTEAYFAPLSGSASEARSIKSLFPGSALLTGAGATETALKQASAPSILHIATHGFFLGDTDSNPRDGAPERTAKVSLADRDNPLLRSGLALAGANRRRVGSDDGILTALEASGLDLWGTRLVVLSACDTGLGEVRNGEGVFGLRRSFVQAGAESLVMSLWPVSDLVARDLMTSYYKNLKQGLGRGDSLRNVQLEMLRTHDHRHPFYWASFIESGDWRSLDTVP